MQEIYPSIPVIEIPKPVTPPLPRWVRIGAAVGAAVVLAPNLTACKEGTAIDPKTVTVEADATVYKPHRRLGLQQCDTVDKETQAKTNRKVVEKDVTKSDPTTYYLFNGKDLGVFDECGTEVYVKAEQIEGE